MVERVSGGYLVTGASVDVLRASNFFDLLKGYDGTLASLEPKPLNDAQTGLRPMIAARDAEQAPDHAVSGSEAEMPNAPFGWMPIETAPRDGTLILTFDRGDIASKRWSDHFDGWEHEFFTSPGDSHWKPIGPIPTTEQKEP